MEVSIEDQVNEMRSTKVIITLWVRWKKSVISFITLDPEAVNDAQDVGDNIGNKYIRIDMPFNNLMTKFLEGSYNEELIQRMFAHIKTQVENPRMPEGGFTLDQIILLHKE